MSACDCDVMFQVHIESRLQAGHRLAEPLTDEVLTAAFDRYLRLEVLLNDKVSDLLVVFSLQFSYLLDR